MNTPTHYDSPHFLPIIEIKNRLGKVTSPAKPSTIMRWIRQFKKARWTYNSTPKHGRPPVSQDTEALVIRLATETQWGYKAIAGELKKLGHHIRPNTVKRILQQHGFPTGGKHHGLPWKEFIKANMDVTWACDMCTEDMLTPAGFIRAYSLFFIHHGSRITYFAGSTISPDNLWMKQQARNFAMYLDEHPELPCTYLIHDRDELLKPLKHVLKSDGVKVVLTPPKAPQANAYAERFMGEVRQVLNELIISHVQQLRYVCRTISDHHNRHRPHQGIDNRVPGKYNYPTVPAKPANVRCEEKLGGLLKHYYVEQKAA